MPTLPLPTSNPHSSPSSKSAVFNSSFAPTLTGSARLLNTMKKCDHQRSQVCRDRVEGVREQICNVEKDLGKVCEALLRLRRDLQKSKDRK